MPSKLVTLLIFKDDRSAARNDIVSVRFAIPSPFYDNDAWGIFLLFTRPHTGARLLASKLTRSYGG